MDVGVRELKQHLSEYLDRAANGEIIRVTDRGQPKAILAPVPGAGRLAAGLEQGWIAGISKLRNGNVVYSDSKNDRLVEITPDKKIVSIFQNREILLHPSTHLILES